MKRCLVGKKLCSGEIATIVAIGALIVIGVTSLFSSAFLGKKQTTSTRADTYTDGQISDQGCAVYGCPAGTKRICTYTSASASWGCQCKPDSSCPGGSTGSGGAGSGGTVTCNEGYYCEGNDCFKKLTSCGRDGPVDKSLCAGQSCGPQASPPTSPPSNTGSGGNDGQSGECSWPDWDCGASKCGSDAGCICGKMGKGFCNPGNCRSEGTGNVCVPNKWGDKSSWGCWGPPAGACAVQPTAVPTQGSSSSQSGGSNCSPGAKAQVGTQWRCCYDKGVGPNTVSYPRYYDISSQGDTCPGTANADCRTITDTGQCTGTCAWYNCNQTPNKCFPRGTSNEQACSQAQNCSQFNGLNNDKACITAGCDYFASYNSAPCNKCVPKGTSIQNACAKADETILACNNVDLSKGCNPLGSASACPANQTKCKDFTNRGGAVVCCPPSSAVPPAKVDDTQKAGTVTVSVTNRWGLPIPSSYTIGLKNSSGWSQSCALTSPLQYYCNFSEVPQGAHTAWISDVYGGAGCIAYYWKGSSQQVTVSEGQNNFSLAWTNTSCSESVVTTSSDVTSTAQSVTTIKGETGDLVTISGSDGKLIQAFIPPSR